MVRNRVTVVPDRRSAGVLRDLAAARHSKTHENSTRGILRRCDAFGP